MAFQTEMFYYKSPEHLDAQSHQPGLPHSGSFPLQILIAHPWGTFLHLQVDCYLKITAIKSDSLLNGCVTKCYMNTVRKMKHGTFIMCKKPNFTAFLQAFCESDSL